jgi:subtilisin family serine protease
MHPSRSRHRLLVLIGCLVAVLAPAVPPVTALAALPSPPAAVSAARQVTLITGDTVTLGAPVGGVPTVAIDPNGGPGTDTSFSTLRREGDVYVVPGDVARLVPDVLDLELFNVTRLVEMGYSDAATDTLPLIVQGPRPLAAVDAARETRPLTSIGALALELPKNGAAAFAAALTGAPAPLSAGVRKVWLDSRLDAADLDTNLQQIGAPELWESGLSGAGIDIAVLDTGVDTTHPDLAGKVTDEANFTTDDSAGDGNGHGTHVASVIGGSGAAADGARKGVAFGARLLSGKVLGDDGGGQASWVIAGMEWAVAQGAEVVNMSLGGPAGYGDDPVTQALERLTAESGTLFVVAAGNAGPRSSSIDTPGVAESALTVGAAKANGGVARFSSRGPILGTFRSKPDLTAPGVGITGARAGGGLDDPYLRMDGTSQATPHVAGAAALLLQQHPDWSWLQLKSALMSTADGFEATPTPEFEGAGLLDLRQAATETLRLGRAAVDLGVLPYPDSTEPVSVELTLTNTGDDTEMATITDEATDVSGRTAPAELVTVEPAELSLPAGKTATVTVTISPGKAQPGWYSGAISVVRKDREELSLPLNFNAEPPRHDLDLTVLDRRGRPYSHGVVWVGNMETTNAADGGGFRIVQLDENGQGTARMAPGPLSVMATVTTPAGAGRPETVSLAGSPELMLDSDMSYTIDARRARLLLPATVDGARTAVSEVSVHYEHLDANRTGGVGEQIRLTPEQLTGRQVFLQPTAPVKYGRAAILTRWRLEAVGEPRGTQADIYDLLLGGATIPDPPVYGLTRTQARKLARFDSDYRVLGKPDTYSDSRQAYTDIAPTSFYVNHPLPAPQRRVELVTADAGVRWRHCVIGPQPEVARLCAPTTAYQPGERQAPTWLRAPTPAVLGSVQHPGLLEVQIALADGEHKGSVWDLAAAGGETLRLWRDGVEQSPLLPGSSYFRTAPEPGLFRLEYTSSPDQDLLPIGSRTRTVWTFPSTGAAEPGLPQVRGRVLNLDFQPGTDQRGRLDPRRPLSMPVRLTSTTGPEDAMRVERGSLRLWVSTDHGQRWRETKVLVRPDGTFLTTAPGLRLRSGQVVSVRAEASAAEGRRIEQTIIDAYPVR